MKHPQPSPTTPLTTPLVFAVATPRERSPTGEETSRRRSRDKSPSDARADRPPALHFVRFAPAPTSPPPPSTSLNRLKYLLRRHAAPGQASDDLWTGICVRIRRPFACPSFWPKAAVELLLLTLEHFRTGKGSNQFAQVQSWVLVAGLAIGGLSQLVYLNYSLTFASPALVCPLAFCFFNLSSIFGAVCLWNWPSIS